MINKVIIDQLTVAYGISELHSAIFIAPKRPFATVPSWPILGDRSVSDK